MAAPIFTAANFLRAMQNTMPRGRAWPRDLASLQAIILSGLAPTYARLQASDNQLLLEAMPSTTTELLPEWEETLGLPDPCIGGNPTIDKRRAQVVARFANKGGQSIAFFTAYALTLGYVITITYDFAPFRFGDRMGSRFGGSGNIFYWTVNTPGPGPLADLECEFERLKPAHTVVLFNYT